ncbi:DsbC/DsbD-like thiol-disulfide interchange protein [Albidovulum inexpectatum]|uniref:DsbC/DsbD-like thiol-disulfide interchange protein n=1 Tax=Albidovulum inexpectatum TaxID=196587 RepID=A0A2S5JIA9_9RHOB|nr:protein-disulfide reductase DsbD domain-containing protein [Albidovulum inexpectatum]PPB81078.1 DsbC/DsbD-like thiol-disulfide interchange protein [Albidovulum inexpectatum]
MRISTAILSFALSIGGMPAVAQPVPQGITDAELRPGWRLANGNRMVALHLKLQPGWKTYWRAPGEAGIPPRFDWSGSRNLRAVAFHWPVPQVFDLNGMEVIGYRDELVLPIEIAPVDPDQPVTVKTSVELGVCETICMPMVLDLAAQTTNTPAPDPVIEAALANQPRPVDGAARCRAEPIRDGLRLTTEITAPSVGPREVTVVELDQAQPVWISAAETARAGDVLRATVDMVPANARPFALDRSALRVTVIGENGKAIEIRGCAS